MTQNCPRRRLSYYITTMTQFIPKMRDTTDFLLKVLKVLYFQNSSSNVSRSLESPIKSHFLENELSYCDGITVMYSYKIITTANWGLSLARWTQQNLPEEEVSWMAEKNQPQQQIFFDNWFCFCFLFFSLPLKISQTLSPSFSWWKSMSWSHDQKSCKKNKEKILFSEINNFQRSRLSS